MKVLHFCKFFPPVPGGMESVVYELAEGLTVRGIEVEVLCANMGQWTVTERRAAGYRVTRAGSLGRALATSFPLSMPVRFQQLRRGCDIIHVHLPDPLAVVVLRLLPPAAKLIVHWHSDVVRQGGLAKRIYDPLQDWLLRRADAVIATSQAYADSSPALRRCAGKTTVIPIGIGDNAARSHPAAVEEIRRRFGNRRIVFSLGRMAHYKGFDVLIDSAALLPDHCVVVAGGEGELLERHRQTVIDRGLTEKIVFVGRIPEQSLPAYFEACSVFCLASVQRSEAYGVVLAEAMSMGRPVVATEIEGSGVGWVNQSGVTGLNVPPGDGKALAGAIMKIVDDEALAERFGKAARQRYVEQLTASTMLDATVGLYERILSAPASRLQAAHS
jgi:glycosyltransferase involved in cell wall biosynthesis